MHIGCPKEIKPQEFRVGLTPNAAHEAIVHGHGVTVRNRAQAMARALPMPITSPRAPRSSAPPQKCSPRPT